MSDGRLQLACQELSRRLRAGEECRAEDFLAADTPHDDESILELLYTEFVVREELGQTPDPEEWYRRFPQWHLDLQEIFQVHTFICDQDASTPVAAVPTESPRDATSPDVGQFPVRGIVGYQLLAEIGRGGMGVVYKARQLSVGREVALKMIIAGEFATREESRRFRNEAMAAASLHHPHIAQVYEAGEVQGQAYLSMELVDGTNLAALLATSSLSARSAAHLLVSIAEAVDHAHQRGVVHRDLKPSNVLITADGQPKITDFGLAKRVSSNETALTRSGVVLGTPNYMAPEQATGQSGNASPAVDVYALGAILYEMLTGRPPFVGDSTLDTLKQVQERPPVSPRKFDDRVPVDLDTICLKCLEKEAHKRYSTAGALADDLQRFLAGRPVSARRAGVLERTSRWCRRRPMIASLVASLCGMAVTAFVIVVALWQIAERNRVTAVKNLQDADQNLALAQQVVNDYVVKVTDDLRLRGEDLRPLRRELLELVVPFYDGAVARYDDSPELLCEQGESYLKLAQISHELGDLKRAGNMCDRAVGILQRLCQQHPGNAELQFLFCQALRTRGSQLQKNGQYAEAERTYQRMLEPLEQLVKQYPNEPKYKRLLAVVHHFWGTMQSYAWKFDDATEHLELAETLLQELLNQLPNDDSLRILFSGAQNNLGIVFLNKQNYSRAADQFRNCLHISATLFDTQLSNPLISEHYVFVMGNLAMALDRLEQPEEAKEKYQNALRVIDEMVALHPSAATYRKMQMDTRGNYGEFLLDVGELSAAEQELRRVAAHARHYLTQHQVLPEVRLRVARNEKLLAEICRRTDRTPEAETLYRGLITQLRRLLEDEPQRAQNHFEYDGAVSLTVQLHREQNQLAQAILVLEEEIEWLEQQGAKYPDVASFAYTLEHLRGLLADLRQQEVAQNS